MPPPVRVADEVTLIPPADPAIDTDRLPEPGDEPTWWDRYCRAERDALDIEAIPIRDGEQPTLLHVRALGARDRDLVMSLSGLSSEAVEDQERRLLSATCYFDWCVRLGLVRVEHWPGWDYARERVHGRAIWPEAVLDAMGSTTAAFVGLAVHRMSTVPFDRDSPSGS